MLSQPQKTSVSSSLWMSRLDNQSYSTSSGPSSVSAGPLVGEAVAYWSARVYDACGACGACDAPAPCVALAVNTDGTLSRITNWDRMSSEEQAVAKRRISKRNGAGPQLPCASAMRCCRVPVLRRHTSALDTVLPPPARQWSGCASSMQPAISRRSLWLHLVHSLGLTADGVAVDPNNVR